MAGLWLLQGGPALLTTTVRAYYCSGEDVLLPPLAQLDRPMRVWPSLGLSAMHRIRLPHPTCPVLARCILEENVSG